MSRRSLPLLTDKKARDVLKNLCKEHNITLELLHNLIEIQRDNLGRGRQFGITQEFSAVISDFIEEHTGTRNAP